MRKICFITGSRAEYGLLEPVMRLVKQSPQCTLQIIATNMHLEPKYGLTYKQIEADGYTIDAKVPMAKKQDSDSGVVDSMAEEMAGMNRALTELKPDIAVILGDRYEMLVAATVCLMHRIPIAHIHGGEITEGAYDDAIRHAITKMVSVHFTATEEYRRRVIQLGEEPFRVFCSGAPGVENIEKMRLLSREELSRSLGISLDRPFLLVTYHPATLSENSTARDIRSLLEALRQFPEHDIIITLPNSDQSSDEIAAAFRDFCVEQPDRRHSFISLGTQRYISLMHLAEAIVGNSSSGIIEAPSANIPTLNIGDRQKGRVRAESVVDCGTDAASIADGLRKVLDESFRRQARNVINPYGRIDTARTIFDVLCSIDLASLKTKHFHDIPSQ